MVYTLDSSFCAALFLPDEESERVKLLFDSISEDDIIYIPHIWWYEISNVLFAAIKRKRLTYSNAIHINSLLSSFNFITDSSCGHAYSEKLIELANAYTLSAYDAAYLELSIRKQTALGSLDKELKKACIDAGVAVL